LPFRRLAGAVAQPPTEPATHRGLPDHRRVHMVDAAALALAAVRLGSRGGNLRIATAAGATRRSVRLLHGPRVARRSAWAGRLRAKDGASDESSPGMQLVRLRDRALHHPGRRRGLHAGTALGRAAGTDRRRCARVVFGWEPPARRNDGSHLRRCRWQWTAMVPFTSLIGFEPRP